MSWLHYVKRMYSLDTLDTRFTTSSKVPLRPERDGAIADVKLPAQAILQSKAEHRASPATQPPKWKTLEFYLYYLIMVFVSFLLVKCMYEMSQGQLNPETKSVTKPLILA